MKYLIGGVVQHQVAIVGKEDGSYLIRDPLIAADEQEALHKHMPVILSAPASTFDGKPENSADKSKRCSSNTGRVARMKWHHFQPL